MNNYITIDLEKKFGISDFITEVKDHELVDIKFANVVDGEVEIKVSALKNLKHFLMPKENVHLRCNKCDLDEPFKVKYVIKKLNGDTVDEIDLDFMGVEINLTTEKVKLFLNDEEEESDGYSQKIQSFEDFKILKYNIQNDLHYGYRNRGEILVVDYTFSCVNCNDSTILSSVILLQANSNRNLGILKIMSYPSFFNLKAPLSNEKKFFLDIANVLQDYLAAEKAYIDGYYVGAATYIRRTFEKIVHYYLRNTDIDVLDNQITKQNKNYVLEGKTKENKISSLNMKNKLVIMKDLYFAPITHQFLDGFYKIVSAAIHEKGETEARKYYEHLITVIDLQLLYEKNNFENEKIVTKLTSSQSEFLDELSDN